MAVYSKKTKVGIYRLENELSNSGGTGVVYEASIRPEKDKFKHRGDKRVALKFARNKGHHKDTFEDLLRREVKLLNGMRHPGIVRVLPIAQYKDNQYVGRASNLPDTPWYFAMELLYPETLKSLKFGNYPLPWRVELLYQLATTLAHMHKHHERAHRDLKPDNVLFRTKPEVSQMPVPVLIDFGLSEKRKATLTVNAATLSHASPERVEHLISGRKGSFEATSMSFDYLASDVWSFGVICYEVLTGRYIYGDVNTSMGRTAIADVIVNKYPDPIGRELPERLGQLVMAMLQPTPHHRPTMKQIIEYLETGIELIPPRI